MWKNYSGKNTAAVHYSLSWVWSFPLPPLPFPLEEGHQTPLSWDDRKVRVTWRGDGEYFACSTFEPAIGKGWAVMGKGWRGMECDR